MVDKNTSSLAGEILVAGELSRHGYLVSITIGNAKSIDFFANTQNGERIVVDVKASRYKISWPIAKVNECLYYIFVYLFPQDKHKIEVITDTNTSPEYYIVSRQDIIKKYLISHWRSIPSIRDSSLQEYKESWGILPPP